MKKLFFLFLTIVVSKVSYQTIYHPVKQTDVVVGFERTQEKRFFLAYSWPHVTNRDQKEIPIEPVFILAPREAAYCLTVTPHLIIIDGCGEVVSLEVGGDHKKIEKREVEVVVKNSKTLFYEVLWRGEYFYITSSLFERRDINIFESNGSLYVAMIFKERQSKSWLDGL